MQVDVAIIGGGPAGIGAAIAASEGGASVVLIEREDELGGILNQCIHNGFGLHYFGEELTGPEYADRFIRKIKAMQKCQRLEVYTSTAVISIDDNSIITASRANVGIINIKAKAIVIATGCRERSAGAIGLCGTRPAGVMTAGFAQKLTNIKGYLPGRNIVILGSGDIGLIMARRMTYEGAFVHAVVEIMSYSSGLKRNIVQCLDDYNIPLIYSHTITRLIGYPRLTGLYIAPVDSNMQPILSGERYIECDTLLLSVGLIPEIDLLSSLDVELSSATRSCLVDDNYKTSADNIFLCGNALHVHDLVDNVSGEGERAGKAACRYALGGGDCDSYYSVSAIGGARYALPQRIATINIANYTVNSNIEATDIAVKDGTMTVGDTDIIRIYYRSGAVYHHATVTVRCGDRVIKTQKKRIITPGEMEYIELSRSLITADISIDIKEDNR